MARYALIRKNDIANGLGVRTTFWVQGCHWHCKNCHNKEQWDFDGGYEFTDETIKEIIEAISANGINRDFTILGGEPFEDINVPMCIEVVKAVKEAYPNINIWIYSGYTYENLIKDEKKMELISMIDVLVDGLFIESLKNLKLKYKGSENQRVIDVPATMKYGKIMEVNFQ